MARPDLNVPGAQYPHIDVHDVQGVILRGYHRYHASAFVFASIEDGARARAWLALMHDEITTSANSQGSKSDDGHEKARKVKAVNIAFTRRGLARLGLPAETLGMFSREFLEGMTFGSRPEFLGDVRDSHPKEWAWGRWNDRDIDHAQTIDFVLLVYAQDGKAVEAECKRLVDELGAGAIRALDPRLRMQQLEHQIEHFGFRDGISQPHIRHANPERETHGALRRSHATNMVNAGEILLGYSDEFGAKAPSPVVEKDPRRFLVTGELGLPDFGHNGSYFVVRQMEQNVSAFWETMELESGRLGVDATTLAAKLVGRWPNGAPLVRHPYEDPGKDQSNDFGYQYEDPNGHRCPFGAHVRRSNPRDALDDAPGALELARDPFQSPTRIANRHRLLRRGRAYGEPAWKDDGNGRKVIRKDDRERGLNFACFVASIRRQFEFVQRTWVNNPDFDGLRGEPDPLVGSKADRAPFTVNGPVPCPRLDLPNFVRVRGGAYFFMPSLRALRYLASL